jgi:hypothetical protein
MGGFGSGRRDGRTLVEDCPALDIAGLVRDGLIVPGGRKAGSLHWREVETGRETASVGYEAQTADAEAATLRLFWRTGSGGDARARSVTIRLATTRQRLGGVRWWLLCPITEKRAGKLYSSPDGDTFASRQALGLAYHSQRLDRFMLGFETAIARATRLRRRLGGPPDRRMTAPVPDRPPRMWRKTYSRLKRDITRAEAAAERFTWIGFAHLVRDADGG